MQDIEKILHLNKFSLIIDETTDIATEKSLGMILRYRDEKKTV